MKQSLSKQILEHLFLCGTHIAVGALFVPYGQGLRQSLRDTRELLDKCPHDFSCHSPQTVSVTLHRMKKQKLVSFNGPNRKAVWHITHEGRKHFKNVKSGNEFDLPPKDGKTRIVVFDIPENRRRDRNWLRVELYSCAYSPLQRSVFIGTRPLPAKLLEELKMRELLSHVHIIGVAGGKNKN